MKSRIVILNGVGSVGKSSIAKALQGITSSWFLRVEMDAFLDMLPESAFGHPEGLVFEAIEENGKPLLVIKTGRAVEGTMRGMRQAVVAMAQQGNSLIVDEVMIGDEKKQDYLKLLSDFDVFWVGVFAPLNVLEERERRRGDRLIGLARWQYDRVHKGKTYDLEIDTAIATPLECARLIKEKFHL